MTKFRYYFAFKLQLKVNKMLKKFKPVPFGKG